MTLPLFPVLFGAWFGFWIGLLVGTWTTGRKVITAIRTHIPPPPPPPNIRVPITLDNKRLPWDGCTGYTFWRHENSGSRCTFRSRGTPKVDAHDPLRDQARGITL